MFLIDTNVFLEILISGPRAPIAKTFLEANAGLLNISDLSFFDLLRFMVANGDPELYRAMAKDLVDSCRIISLERPEFVSLLDFAMKNEVPFRVAYHLKLAFERGLTVVTLDRAYDKSSAVIEVKYL